MYIVLNGLKYEIYMCQMTYSQYRVIPVRNVYLPTLRSQTVCVVGLHTYRRVLKETTQGD